MWRIFVHVAFVRLIAIKIFNRSAALVLRLTVCIFAVRAVATDCNVFVFGRVLFLYACIMQ